MDDINNDRETFYRLVTENKAALAAAQLTISEQKRREAEMHAKRNQTKDQKEVKE